MRIKHIFTPNSHYHSPLDVLLFVVIIILNGDYDKKKNDYHKLKAVHVFFWHYSNENQIFWHYGNVFALCLIVMKIISLCKSAKK